MTKQSKQNLLMVIAAVSIAALSSGCRERLEPPQSVLSEAETEHYRSATRFEELFEPVRTFRLAGEEDFPLSVRPLLKEINKAGELVVLDKLNVRDVVVFTPDGVAVGRIGGEGYEPGKYIYPHTVAYDRAQEIYYVYDGDLLRTSVYASDFRFERLFQMPLFLDTLTVTDNSRIYGYMSSKTGINDSPDLVYELDAYGKVIRSFAPQSSNYNGWAATEGGGVVSVDPYLYFITPYELSMSVFSQDGDLLLHRELGSPRYVPPGPAPPEPADDDAKFKALDAYHRSWSHIRQVLSLGDKVIAVVIGDPGLDSCYLSLFSLDLEPLAVEIDLPPFLGDLHAHGDSLYLMAAEREEREGKLLNPTVIEYRLTSASAGSPKNLARGDQQTSEAPS